MGRSAPKIAFVDNPIFQDDIHRRSDDQGRLRSSAQEQQGLSQQTHIITVHNAQQQEEDDEIVQAMYPKQQQLLRRMRWEFWVVNLLVLAHILITGWLDPLQHSSSVLQILMASLQIGILLAIPVAFFVLTSQTLFVILGRYDKYLKAFWVMYGSLAVELALMVASKAYYIVLVMQHTPHISIWKAKGFLGLWVVQRVLLCVFWVATVHSSFKAFEPRWYDPEYLMAP